MHSHPQVTLSYKEAGLPNIKGTFGRGSKRNFEVTMYTLEDTSGAFQITDLGTYNGLPNQGSNKNTGRKVSFDASLCSEVYGRSGTVQPLAMTVNYFIRAK